MDDYEKTVKAVQWFPPENNEDIDHTKYPNVIKRDNNPPKDSKFYIKEHHQNNIHYYINDSYGRDIQLVPGDYIVIENNKIRIVHQEEFELGHRKI